MIIYFTSTGNSLSVANQYLNPDVSLTDMFLR